jgi:ATP-dependent helicase YprA (DUF1998 family)
MSILKLAKYTGDTNHLEEDGDAAFLKRKVSASTIFDFAGVAGVSAGFLDVLFEGETPESIADRIAGAGSSVDGALAAWIDRQSKPRAPITRTKSRPKVRVAQKTSAPLTLDRPPAQEERFTPTRLVRRLRETLRGYIESAYPLSDPLLVKSRRIVLEKDAGGHLLAQVPFIETTPRYTSSELSYTGLGLPKQLGQFLERLAVAVSAASRPDAPRTVLFSSMYTHQAQAFQAVLRDHHDIVVATGTGSGKTECFLIPILGTLYEEARARPASFAQPGVRALILYPMNALVNDQLSRLRLLFGDPALASEFSQGGRFPRFGMYTGRTQYAGPRSAARDGERVAPLLEYYLGMDADLEARLRLLGRYPAKDLRAFYAAHEEKSAKYKSGKKAGQEHKEHHWKKRLHTGAADRELLTRQEMVHGVGTLPGHSPDILVTNYSMLEYMLMRPFERPIFEETRNWLQTDGNQLVLVLDEAHMYRGAKGAEVAFLLRRLRARLGIHDKADKLRVIATSASLGSDKAALTNVKRFAADLTGKDPGSFEAIVGAREVPEPAAPASKAEGDMLAALDVEAVGRALTGQELRSSLNSVFAFYGAPCSSSDEREVLAHLHDVLQGRPFVNQLIKAAAGSARDLASLSRDVFSDHPEASPALEGLLTLGTLARQQVDAPALIPTRLHAMFRGVHGLYACINQTCMGRQVGGGERATLGRLFSTPQARCDACGSRVFEIASCRNCGTPYVLAYVESGRLATFEFLWGETEGEVTKLELLPSQPRYPDRTEEFRVHLSTGYVDAVGDPDSRSLFLSLDADGNRQAEYDRCAMCQPSGSARSRIQDFRTRGEQPFTALIEAQFAEQPPQKSGKGLPNEGRKVLVFSDGRQKAARLAPALEHSHARDLFRQVIALGAAALEKQENTGSGMQWLYPAVVWLCTNRGFDLFPSADEIEFHNHLRRAKGKSLDEALKLANQGGLKATKSFAQALFSEFTDRYYSLPALGLATVEESPHFEDVFDSFPKVGLDVRAQKALFRAWVRLHLERKSFKPEGAEIRELGEGWSTPQGISADKMSQVLPGRFEEYLRTILSGDEPATNAVGLWFQTLVRDSTLLDFEGDLYYLKPLGLSLHLRLEEAWLRCTDCGRIHPESLADTCPGCLGNLVQADPDYLDARTGFYREQVRRAFDPAQLEPFGLSAAEHSAQLTGEADETAFNRVEEYELRFQDIPLKGQSPIDVLSCTTTMEVGIDIGALSGVALRNVPPHVANYQQRAGRAGRRGRSIASVMTYAHGTSHDAHFFEHPEQMISGDVRPPTVYVENQKVLERHVFAYLLQRFVHDQVPSDTKSSAFALFASLGTVEQFLSGAEVCSLTRMEAWLGQNELALKHELHAWAPKFSHGLQEAIPAVNDTIDHSITNILSRVKSVLPVAEYGVRDQLVGVEKEALERRLEESLLATLIGHAVLPRYAFPTDVVSFWVSRQKRPGDPPGRRFYDYEPQRDLQLALSEYAPGRSLTIDKWRFQSAALYSPYEPTPESTIARRQPYTACRSCSFVSLTPESAMLASCPCCSGVDIEHTSFLVPSGFAPDVNDKREVDKGEPIVYAGITGRAQLEVQDLGTKWDKELYSGRLKIWTGPQMLAMVNKGVKDRGFRVCPECGRSEPEYGPGFTETKLMKNGVPASHKNPLEVGVVCAGTAVGPYYLGHRFPTDVLLLRVAVKSPTRLGATGTPGLLSRASRMALSSLVEAIALAASRKLQIDEGELSGWWSPVLGGKTDEAQLYLYDLLPGGAGYARAVGSALSDVLDATEELLKGCDCAQSCYRCIRHYRNNYIHASLDRHLALALLRHIQSAANPSVSTSERASALVGLEDYLQLRGIAVETDVVVDGVQIPMIVRPAGREVWVDVHHALIDPEVAPSPAALKARAAFKELVQLDTFTLAHDLPSAVAALQI